MSEINKYIYYELLFIKFFVFFRSMSYLVFEKDLKIQTRCAKELNDICVLYLLSTGHTFLRSFNVLIKLVRNLMILQCFYENVLPQVDFKRLSVFSGQLALGR